MRATERVLTQLNLKFRPSKPCNSGTISPVTWSTVCHDHLREFWFIKTELALGLVTLSSGANPMILGLVTLSFYQQLRALGSKVPSRRSPMSLNLVFQVKHKFCLAFNRWRAHVTGTLFLQLVES